MDEVSRHSVVVLLRTGGKWNRELSPPIVRALGTEVTGKIIPRLAVASPDLDSVWATMTYEEIKGGRKLRDLRGTVNDIAAGRASAPEVDPVQRWTLTDGRFYQGTFVRIEGERLVLKIRESGNEVDLPLSDYAPGTIPMPEQSRPVTVLATKPEHRPPILPNLPIQSESGRAPRGKYSRPPLSVSTDQP